MIIKNCFGVAISYPFFADKMGKGTWIYIVPQMTSISSSRRSDMDHTV